MNLHKKILELRSKVGYQPIYTGGVHGLPVDQIRQMNSDTSSRLLKQYFCIWGEKDDYGCIPVKGCFSKSLEERGPSSNSNFKIPVLWQHDQRKPLCKPSVLIEDEVGLYGEYSPDEGVEVCDTCVIQVRSGTINNGSYGFNYIWDKMKYDEKTDAIYMYECNLFEVSPVTIPSQLGTFAVRSAAVSQEIKDAMNETEALIKKIPRKYQLELRSIIQRHISLASIQPDYSYGNPLPGSGEPIAKRVNLKYIADNFNL